MRACILMTPLEDILRKEILKLQKQNAALMAENNRLVAENERLRSPNLIPHMGVLWKRAAVGFEPQPYCQECSSHPVMTPKHEAHIWVCATGEHHAPLSVMPPSA